MNNYEKVEFLAKNSTIKISEKDMDIFINDALNDSTVDKRRINDDIINIYGNNSNGVIFANKKTLKIFPVGLYAARDVFDALKFFIGNES